MKNEMIKFVSENFILIFSNFYKSEKDAILNCDGCDESDLDNLDCDFENANSAEELIELINERSIGVDLDDEDESEELFNMIKVIQSSVKYVPNFEVSYYKKGEWYLPSNDDSCNEADIIKWAYIEE